MRSQSPPTPAPRKSLRERLAEVVGTGKSAEMAPTGNPRVFSGGQIAFAEILRRVEETQDNLEMRAFLWRDDDAGNRLGRAILRAADRGVKVLIQKDRIAAVYEYWGGNRQSFFHKKVQPSQGLQAWFLGTVYRAKGSFKQRPNPLAEAVLAHPNITVRHSRKRFDHSKLFVFDDRFIVLGSMGIGDNHHTEWVDVMTEVDGAEHVKRLRERVAGEAEFDASSRIDFLVHSRDIHPPKTCPMVDQRLSLIDTAERSVTVEMAYLGDRRFTAALRTAVKRGLEVTLITSRADVLGNLNLAICDKLLRVTGAPDNLTIVLLPRMVHSKIVVVDGQYSDIGSANFTPLSHGVYDEINMYVNDEVFAQNLEAVMVEHSSEGRIVERRIGYRRLTSQIERAIMAYQSRKGG